MKLFSDEHLYVSNYDANLYLASPKISNHFWLKTKNHKQIMHLTKEESNLDDGR